MGYFFEYLRERPKPSYNSLTPVKLCDFDLGSEIKFHSGGGSDTTPLLFTPVGSAEFMAPEIVEAFIDDTEDDFKYDKRCEYLFLLDLF